MLNIHIIAPMSKTIIRKRSKQKEIDPKFGVSEWDPAELDVRQTRHGTYESRPPPRGGTWRDQIKEEAYKLRQRQREADSPEFISPHSTTDTMDTDEAQEINKQIMEKIEKEPEGSEYLNIVSEGKYESVGETLDTGATFSTVAEMQAEVEEDQQAYEEIESLEDSHIVSFPKLDKEKEALRRKTQGKQVPFETEDLMTSLTNITEPPPIAFTDPLDFDEVLREGDEYLSKIEEDIRKPREERVMEITLSDSKSAIIPAEIAHEKCKVLIDTGASRSFMREDYFKKLSNAKLMPTLRDVRIRSATGRDVQTSGRTVTQFKLGATTYTSEFIICRNLRRPAILGIDFLRRNRLGTTWTEEGKFALQKGDDILVESIEVFFEDTYPKLKAIKCMDIQARSIVVITTRADFQIQDQGKIFEVKPIEEFTVNHHNLITLPIIHKTDTEHRENVPYLLINLSNEDEHILKEEEIAIMEELMINSDQIYKEADKQEDKEQLKSDLKVRKNEIHFEEEINYMDDELVIKPCESDEEEEVEKKFITSPADVETQRKVKLQDAYITEIDKARFRCLCNEFEDIFSKSSEDIGHTPLVTMDIDTGDSRPVCQKPYSLALKHVEWVQKELETLERAGVIQRSMSPWASPIVIVPKKSEPGEPPKRRMCVDYRMLNSLLPPVNKAHSKAKGIVTLVPLPKIDGIYAQLQGSKIFSALDMRSGYFHIELSEEAKPKTAFVPGGPHGSKYQFNRCPL